MLVPSDIGYVEVDWSIVESMKKEDGVRNNGISLSLIKEWYQALSLHGYTSGAGSWTKIESSLSDKGGLKWKWKSSWVYSSTTTPSGNSGCWGLLCNGSDIGMGEGTKGWGLECKCVEFELGEWSISNS